MCRTRRDGGFEIAAICNPANMPKVRAGFTEEINRLLENGVTQAELDAAKKAILAARRTFSDAEILFTLADQMFEGAIEGGLEGEAVERAASVAEASERLAGHLGEGDVVLVKGSRAAHMEDVVEMLRSRG